jgi:hypothetical protein
LDRKQNPDPKLPEKSDQGRIDTGVSAKEQVPVPYYFGTVLFSRGGDQSREAKIKLPPGAGAEITNFGSVSDSFLCTTDLKKFVEKKIMFAVILYLNQKVN